MPARLLVPLLVVLAGFQSHWLDDVLTGAPDTAGIVVSVVGSALVLLGWWRWPTRLGIAILALACVIVGLISVADLAGLRADGSMAPSMVEHWSTELGTTTAVTVAVTLAAATSGLAALTRTRR